MKKIAIYGFLLILASLQVACKDWLDVKPKTAVEEDVLFSTEQGFKENLTGIYLLLASKDLYGRELSYGITDILAQRYEPGGGSDIPELKFADNDWYKFPSVKTEGYVNSIWKNMYKVIANINNFLTWIDKNKEVLTTPDYYEIMKGEDYGLLFISICCDFTGRSTIPRQVLRRCLCPIVRNLTGKKSRSVPQKK